MLVPSLVRAARRAASLQKTRRRQLGDRRRRYHVCGERDRLVASYSEIRRRSCAGGVRHLLTDSNFNNKSTPCLTICKRECEPARKAPFGRVGLATRRGCTERSEQRAGPRCAGACAVSPSCGKFRELGTQFMASVANFCRAFRPLRDFYCIGTHESARWDANVCTHGDTRRAGPVIGLPRRPKTAHAKSKSCHGEHVLRTAGPSSAACSSRLGSASARTPAPSCAKSSRAAAMLPTCFLEAILRLATMRRTSTSTRLSWPRAR